MGNTDKGLLLPEDWQGREEICDWDQELGAQTGLYREFGKFMFEVGHRPADLEAVFLAWRGDTQTVVVSGGPAQIRELARFCERLGLEMKHTDITG